MILVDGQACQVISVADRGLNYGDGVFRTIRVRQGVAHCWERHLRKLASDCASLNIPLPALNSLESDLKTITDADFDCVLKIIVTRGVSGRGYAVEKGQKATRIFSSTPIPIIPKENYLLGVKVLLCVMRLALQPRLAGIKHLNRLENILARNEWEDLNVAEGLMFDTEDNVVEGTMTNLFIVEKGVLVTPDLARCGVAGIQRDRVIEFATKNGLRYEIRHLKIEDVMTANEVFLVNSVIGLWPIRELLDRRWDTTKLTISNKVSQWLDDQSN